MREIGLNPSSCMTMYVVVHEILHVVGVKYEQCRPDRDDFISIDWSNICSDGESQYYKVIVYLMEEVKWRDCPSV